MHEEIMTASYDVFAARARIPLRLQRLRDGSSASAKLCLCCAADDQKYNGMIIIFVCAKYPMCVMMCAQLVVAIPLQPRTRSA